MAEVQIIEWPSDVHRFTVDNYSGAAAGDWIEARDVSKVDSVLDPPVCVIVEAPSTEFPQQTLLGLGNGALLDLGTNVTAGTPGTVMYSDGDGTISSTKPTSSAGAVVWMVGVLQQESDTSATSTLMRVQIAPIRAEA